MSDTQALSNAKTTGQTCAITHDPGAGTRPLPTPSCANLSIRIPERSKSLSSASLPAPIASYRKDTNGAIFATISRSARRPQPKYWEAFEAPIDPKIAEEPEDWVIYSGPSISQPSSPRLAPEEISRRIAADIADYFYPWVFVDPPSSEDLPLSLPVPPLLTHRRDVYQYAPPNTVFCPVQDYPM